MYSMFGKFLSHRIHQLLAMFSLALLGIGIWSQSTPVLASGVDSFIHIATAANTTGNATLIDNPLAHGDMSVALVVTPVYNPGGVGGVYNNHPIAVRISPTSGMSDVHWEIFNRDNAPMPAGAAFNVAIWRGGTEILQRANTGMIGPNYILFDHPQLNSTPNALAIITLINIATGATPMTSPVGVWYEGTSAHWGGFNEDNSPFESGWAFNVAAYSTEAGFLHTTSTSNISSNWSYIDHPFANNNPNAIILVSHSWNPNGMGGTYHPHEIGVWYDTSVNRWAIFNQDQSLMASGVAFNVLVVGSGSTLPAMGGATTAAPTPTTSGPIACPITRLTGATYARVLPGVSNRLRTGPARTYAVISQLNAGTIVDVLGEQTCDTTAGILWVKVRYAGTIGWSAEGQATDYYMEPSSAPAPSSGFGIVGTTATSSSVGGCPATINFTGQIVVNQAGTVTYRWERSDGATGPTQTWVATAGNTTLDTSDSWTLSSGSGWERIHVLTPNDIYSNQATFPTVCGGGAPLPQVTGVTISVSPANSAVCPADNFTFTANITTNGPTTVQYRWMRSDGATAPVQTLTFAAAGTQTITDSWTIGAGGTFYKYIAIISPNAMNSNQAVFTRTACP